MGPRPAAALLLVLLVLAAAAAARGGDIEDLRRLLAEDRAAHLDRDPALIASHVADSLVSVDAGRVEVLSRGEVEAFFRGYFAGAVFFASSPSTSR